jgi:glucosamine-6-phosphate deaminase
MVPLMKIRVFPDADTLSQTAASDAASLLRQAIDTRGEARVVAATGTSQVAFLDALCAEPGIRWDRVELFHLDEYLGLSIDHPASFRRFLLDRLIHRTGIERFHLLDGTGDPRTVLRLAGAELTAGPIDVCFAGIGENAHLAFNDPPADFGTDDAFLVVELDEVCRQQQVGEGWFATLADVPTRAITMSVGHILEAHRIICLAPGTRKARAIAAAFGDDGIDPMVPASALRSHAGTTVYLDRDAASGLSEAQLARWTH